MAKFTASYRFLPPVLLVSGIVLLPFAPGCGGGGGGGTNPTASPTPSPSVTPRPSPGTSPQPGVSPAPVVSPSPGGSPNPSESPSPQPSPSPGDSPSPIVSPTPAPTPTPTPVPTPTPTPTPVPTPVPSPTPPPTPQTNPRFTIRWAQRGRAINAPSSALSAVLTLVGARPDGTNAVATINRNANRDAYEGTYNFSHLVFIGTYTLHVRFYAGQNGSGAVVAEGDARPTIAGDGSGIDDIAVTGVITQVEVPAQSISYPGKKQLIFSPKDSQGNLVAVSPGSAFFTVVEGNDFLRITDDQYAEGIRTGTGSVVASVDNRRSAPVPIQVTSTAVIHITPKNPLVAIGGQVRFSATVDNVPDQGVRWRMKNEGTGTIDANGIYTAPSTPGDYIIIASSEHDPAVTAEMTVRARGGNLPIIIE